jgi:hypothetical protein
LVRLFWYYCKFEKNSSYHTNWALNIVSKKGIVALSFWEFDSKVPRCLV